MPQAERAIDEVKIPMVEIFQTIEGEGTRAGYPTTFVRLFHCNLRCTWCDTPYSYAPAKPEFQATIADIISEVKRVGHPHICLTGGEPLIHGEKSLLLIQSLAKMEEVRDIHVETNGAISLSPFHEWRSSEPSLGEKVRFILDYKLPASGEQDKMIDENFACLRETDEVKFVIADQADFQVAVQMVRQHLKQGVPLFSPVWGKVSPARLVEWMLAERLTQVRLNLQLHKIIWDPNARGV